MRRRVGVAFQRHGPKAQRALSDYRSSAGRRKNRAFETMVVFPALLAGSLSVQCAAAWLEAGLWSSNREGVTKCALGPLPVNLDDKRRPGPRGYSPPKGHGQAANGELSPI